MTSNDTQAAVDAAERRILALRSDLGRTENDLRRMTNQRNGLYDTISDLRRQVAERTHERDAARAQYAALQRLVDGLLDHLAAWAADVASVPPPAMPRLDAAIGQLTAWCEQHDQAARSCSYCLTDPAERGEIDESRLQGAGR